MTNIILNVLIDLHSAYLVAILDLLWINLVLVSLRQLERLQLHGVAVLIVLLRDR